MGAEILSLWSADIHFSIPATCRNSSYSGRDLPLHGLIAVGTLISLPLLN